MVGLKWEDVDFKSKTIQIRRSMEYRYSAKEWRIGEPKSRSGYRTLPLTEEAVAILKKQKEFYPKIDCFMEKIFELVVTGIKSRKEMAVISIDVFRSLCNFERSLPEAQRKNYSEKTFELAVSTAISLLLSTPPTATEDMDPGTAEQEALSVLSEFCLFCPTQMIEGPQTNKALTLFL